MIGYQHALGSQLSNAMKAHLMQLLRQGLSPMQVMTYHKSCVKEQAQRNEHVTHDTFVLPSNVKNLAKKRADKLWQKHPKDPISVRMWVLENPKLVIFYLEHAPLDLNLLKQDETPFTLRIQTTWQLKMMANFGHGSCL